MHKKVKNKKRISETKSSNKKWESKKKVEKHTVPQDETISWEQTEANTISNIKKQKKITTEK